MNKSIALLLVTITTVAHGSDCSQLAPAWAGGSYSASTSDTHTYNPYSSAANELANANHEPKEEGESGHWVTENFTVTCASSEAAFLKASITAFISNSKGDPACAGGIVTVSNTSSHPVYFGLSGVLNDKADAGATRHIELAIYRSKNDTRPTREELTAKYWVEGTQTVRNAAQNPANQPCNRPKDSDHPVTAALQIKSAYYVSPRNHQRLEVTNALQSNCVASRCSITCNNELAGDPDFGQQKYCDVSYTCLAGITQRIKVAEGENQTLRCTIDARTPTPMPMRPTHRMMSCGQGFNCVGNQ